MSVGYITRRVGLPFNGCRTGGLIRPEKWYSNSDDQVGSFAQLGVVIELGGQVAGTTKARDAIR